MSKIFVTSVDLSDERIQVFAVDGDGSLETRWKASTDPNSAWTAWQPFQTPGGGVTTIAGSELSDGRVQLFATLRSGDTVSSWKEGGPDSAWTPWSAF